jgi:AAA+ ATPase superfamily predicted ATPase
MKANAAGGHMFIGRKTELELLESDYASRKSEFCVVYGRRRIGKSTLLEKFCHNKTAFFFTGGKERKHQQTGPRVASCLKWSREGKNGVERDGGAAF